MVDADGSADPSEIPRFVQALLSGADFAKGTRFAAGGGSSDITRLRGLGNRLLGAVSISPTGTTTQISAMDSTCSGRSMFRTGPRHHLSPFTQGRRAVVGRRLRDRTLIDMVGGGARTPRD